jgi:hypothetical protein
MGSVFVGSTNLYTEGEDSVKPIELWRQTRTNVNQWNNLLHATGGALKSEKCVGYLIDFNCIEGVWEYTAESEHEITITNSNRDRNTINQKVVSTEMKTLGVYDLPTGRIKGHLDNIKKKTSTWINIMKMGICQAT